MSAGPEAAAPAVPGAARARPPAAGLVRLARLAVGVFFRSLEVDGAEQVPRNRPLLVVANHVNGLVDPALLLAALPVAPRFLGKSTLWRITALRPLLEWAGVIPVHRRQDTGGDTSGNADTFARCHAILAGGGCVALFPEGISHSQPALAPLRTGAARIALEAERLHGPLGVRVLPVGLVFERKDRFRSRVLVQIGAPLDPGEELARYAAEVDRAAAARNLPAPDEPGARAASAESTEPGGSAAPAAPTHDAGPGADQSPAQGHAPAAAAADAANPAAREPGSAAVRTLTARIDSALRQVTLNYSSWQEARLLARAAALFAGTARPLPRRDQLATGVDLARAFGAGYSRLHAAFPQEVAAVARSVERYDRLLSRLRLRDEQVLAHYPRGAVLAWLLRMLMVLALLLPLAVVGSLLNLPAWLAVDLAARRYGSEPDQAATWKLLPALAAYPLGWLAAGVAVGVWRGPLTGLVAALVAAATALPALRFHERRARLVREARAFLLLRSTARLGAELRERREAAARAVAGLVERANGA